MDRRPAPDPLFDLSVPLEDLGLGSASPVGGEAAAARETLYRIRDTECNSRVFGPCEVCGKEVVQVFHQVRSERWFAPQIGRTMTVDKGDAYGHYACLLSCRPA